MFCTILFHEFPFIVPIEVNVTADRTVIPPGGVVDITCAVTEDESVTYAYSWSLNGTVLAGETATTLSLFSFGVNDTGTYTCEVSTANGAGIDSITIRLGGEAMLW